MAPDGRWLITAVGSIESSMWLHQPGGNDRQLSTEGYAFSGQLSPDGKRAYYITRRRNADSKGESRSSTPGNVGVGELTVLDLASGSSERPFSDIPIYDYDFAPDQKTVVFSSPNGKRSALWVGSLEHRSAPRKLEGLDADTPFFIGDDEIICRISDGNTYHAIRVKLDGSARQPLFGGAEVVRLESVSPDHQWAAAWMTVNESNTSTAVFAYNLNDGSRVRVCDFCWLTWSVDGKSILVDFLFGTPKSVTSHEDRVGVWVIPNPAGKTLPALPAGGLTVEEIQQMKGVTWMAGNPGAGSTPARYILEHHTVQRNLYRVPLQ
jgi:Tol biopolymer transport system component